MKRWLASAAAQIGLEAPARRWWRQLAPLHGVFNYSRNVKINGRLIRIPHIRGVSFTYSEPWMLDLLRHLLLIQDGAFFDIGANLGQTLVKVKALDWDRKYVGFEPNPSCVSYLTELAAANHFARIKLFPVALGTSNRVLVLESYTDSRVDSSASLIPAFRPGSRIFSRSFVPTLTFDALQEQVQGQVGIVKIDVEGAELDVLNTLLPLVQSERPFVIIEVLPTYSDTNKMRKDRQERLEALFSQNDYKLYRIQKAEADRYAGLISIETIGVHSDVRQSDYLVAPAEKSAKLDTK